MPRTKLDPSLKVTLREPARHLPPIGRPSGYQDKFVQTAYELALLGAIDTTMARAFGVSIETFYRWQEEHPDFYEAICNGKDPADARVAHSVYNSALGFERRYTKRIKVGTPEEEEVEVVEYIPPNHGAQKYWLGVRRRGEWTEKKEVDPTPPPNPVINLTFNASDPQEAQRMYHKLIQGGE